MLNIFNSFKDINFIEEVNNDVNLIGKQKLKEKYENLDQELREQNRNGQNSYILLVKKNKMIKTPFGNIIIKTSRFVYRNKKDNKFKTTTLINKKIGLKNNQIIILSIKIELWKLMSSGKRQRDIMDMYPKLNISKITITNINKEIDFSKLFKEQLKTNTEKIMVQKPYLYAGVDDSFSNLTKYRKIEKNMFRTAYFHTVYNEIKSPKSKNVLKDKKIFIVMKSTKNKYHLIKKYKKEFLYFLNQNFNIKNCKLTLAGDGATWIQKFANEIRAIFILDEFHLMKELKTIFTYRRRKITKNLSNNEKIRKQIYWDMNKLFKNSDPDEAIKYLKKLIKIKNIKEYPFLKNKKGKIKKFINYINKRKDGIKVYKEDWYMSYCTESQISHNVKWLKGYGTKSYSEKVFKNMIAIKTAKENSVNLIDFYLNKLNKINEKEYDCYFRNEDNYNQQFLINKNSAHQTQAFL